MFLKREDVHELGAFKWRGALPALEAFREAGADAVVTASTGNHGAATAWAAARTGMRAIVFAPQGAARAKLELIEQLGAEIRLVGDDFDEAKAAARRMPRPRGCRCSRTAPNGRSTRATGRSPRELLAQLDRPPAAVVVPLGNGALLGGIGLELCERSPARCGSECSRRKRR